MTKLTFKHVLHFLGLLLSMLLVGCGGGEADEREALKTNSNIPSEVTSGFNSRSNETNFEIGRSAEIFSLLISNYGSFDDEMTSFDTFRWHAAQWNNEAYFVNGWFPSQLLFSDGHMNIKLEADVGKLTGKTAISGEYRTNATYAYGLYKARFKASKTPGTISGFFTYTGPSNATQHDEIDIEVLGDDPTRLQVNYWSNGIEHPTFINLGFDASVAYHDYAFRWTSTEIQWYVDGLLVHTENGSRGSLPVTAGQIMLNHWGTVGALPWSTNYIVSTPPSLMSVDRVSFTLNAPSSIFEVSISALVGRAQIIARGWHATVLVTIRDAKGVPVSGAVVNGGFTTGGLPLSCTTTNTGICNLTSLLISSSTKSSMFYVTSITGKNMTYNSSKNVLTSIMVVR